mgnify:CR=1 FL=1
MSNIYKQFGIQPVINGRGNQTLIGGSTPPKEVQDAMDQALSSYVVMEELLRNTGEFIADTLGTESAFVTSGAAAAIALGSAAALAGDDREKMSSIPDTSGMKNEFVFQKCQDYTYKRCFTIPGAKIVEAGGDHGCTREELEACIGPNTAAVAYFESGTWGDSVLTIEEARDIAHAHDLPLVVDAAGQIYPLERFQRVAQTGDIVAFGAKYFGSPHSTGICAGNEKLVESAFQQNFIGYEIAGQQGLARPFGRPFKTDRSEIIGVAVALRRWFSINHEDRLAVEDLKRKTLADSVKGLVGVKAEIPSEPPIGPGVQVNIRVDEELTGKSAQQVIEEMENGDPPILLRSFDGESISVGVQVLTEEETEIVAARFKKIFGS